MSKTVTPTTGEAPTAQPSPSPKKSFTNWKAFADAGLVPVEIKCQAWKPVYLSDNSCHTRLISVDQIKNHIAAEHGGGFQIYLRKTDGKPAKIWQDFADSGLEALSLKCDVCDKELRFHPTSFIGCLKSHRGKIARAYMQMQAENTKAIGKFNLAIGYGQPENREEADEYGD